MWLAELKSALNKWFLLDFAPVILILLIVILGLDPPRNYNTIGEAPQNKWFSVLFVSPLLLFCFFSPFLSFPLLLFVFPTFLSFGSSTFATVSWRAKRAENFWDTISTKLRICIFWSPRIDTISTKHYFYRRAERAWEKYVTISTNTTISTILFSQNVIISPDILFFL